MDIRSCWIITIFSYNKCRYSLRSPPESSLRGLDFFVRCSILGVLSRGILWTLQLHPEIVHCANPHLTGAKTVVQCVSPGLFILAQKVQVKTRHADTLVQVHPLVPGGGLEPPRPCGLRILSCLARRPPVFTSCYLVHFYGEACSYRAILSAAYHPGSHQISHQERNPVDTPAIDGA